MRLDLSFKSLKWNNRPNVKSSCWLKSKAVSSIFGLQGMFRSWIQLLFWLVFFFPALLLCFCRVCVCMCTCARVCVCLCFHNRLFKSYLLELPNQISSVTVVSVLFCFPNNESATTWLTGSNAHHAAPSEASTALLHGCDM